jgi:hypothetical protein
MGPAVISLAAAYLLGLLYYKAVILCPLALLLAVFMALDWQDFSSYVGAMIALPVGYIAGVVARALAYPRATPSK